ncbi:MAG: FkbM family methyltransferase [Myxococcales bacterium]|nr:FkbM family methyltransferase [Myxococcales bacterium]
MKSHDRQCFEQQVAILESPRWRKMVLHPWRPVLSRLLTRYAALLGKVISADVRTFWGDEMTVVLPEVVSTCIFNYRIYEPGLTLFALEYCEPGMVFADVGAHFGYFTLLASHLVGESGSVHALEPTPSTYAVLEKNALGRKNVTLHNIAAWSTSTQLEVNDFGVPFSAFNSAYQPRLSNKQKKRAKASQYSAAALPLDEFFARHGINPGFIKIDAESAEKEILLGLVNTLTSSRPIVSIEVGDQNIPGVASSRELLDSVLQFGYDAMEYKRGKIVRHQLRSTYDYSNILFLPR